MVRAGAVQHPSKWSLGGYNKICQPKERYSIINRNALINILGMEDESQLQKYYKRQIEDVIKKESISRESKWMGIIAVGGRQFVETTKNRLGIKATGRKIVREDGVYDLRENQEPYRAVFDHEKVDLRPGNSYTWSEYDGITE